MPNNIDLFSDFSALSDEAWKSKVKEDLKGRDFAETLLWRDEQGIEHQPYYRATSIEDNPLISAIQEAQKASPSWIVAQVIPFEGAETELKSSIENAAENGVEEVIVSGAGEEFAEKLSEEFAQKGIQLCFTLPDIPKNNKIVFQSDLIGEYLKDGSSKPDIAKIKSVFETNTATQGHRFLLVDGGIYKSAGANIVQEMAAVLQHALSYLDELTAAGLSAAAIAKAMQFKLTFGNSYFVEIAKSRALRYLIGKLFKAYEVNEEASIWGSGSASYLAHKDPYTNLLRTTTQSMAAIIGNCNKVSALAFDSLQASSKLGLRMAKNIPLILSEEAYLQEVSGMADGAYYIESLSAELAEKAWVQFLEMENAGGLMHMFESGQLQKDFDKAWEQRLDAYEKKGKNMVGVNQYINEKADVLAIRRQDRGSKGLKIRLLATEIEA